jgi:hypothetical protein
MPFSEFGTRNSCGEEAVGVAGLGLLVGIDRIAVLQIYQSSELGR